MKRIVGYINNMTNRQVLGLLVFIVVATSLWSAVVNPSGYDAAWLSGWLQNFSTEMSGAIATFLLFELILGGRQRRTEAERAQAADKERLIRALGSKLMEDSIRAADDLRAKGWLKDGTLREVELTYAVLNDVYFGDVDFRNANLRDSSLVGAHLRGALLEFCQLERCDLTGAKLRGAKLHRANLLGAVLIDAECYYTNFSSAKLTNADATHANFKNADFFGARLKGANLQGADLTGANLCGAGLRMANLLGANLADVSMDTDTILPDGNRWAQGYDLSRFTDPAHPKFFQPPAFAADDEDDA